MVLWGDHGWPYSFFNPDWSNVPGSRREEVERNPEVSTTSHRSVPG